MGTINDDMTLAPVEVNGGGSAVNNTANNSNIDNDIASKLFNKLVEKGRMRAWV
jgi:hypothetical protein